MKTNKPQIGIIGAGTMGRGIAQVAATAGHPVVLFDANYAALRKAENDLNALMDKLVQKGKITQSNARSILDNIHYSEENTKLHDSSVIIEAIVEDLRIKKEVFSTLKRRLQKIVFSQQIRRRFQLLQ